MLDALGTGLWRWIQGQLLDMVAVAVMTGAGLWLIGVPLFATLGLIAGITNVIPYVGPFLSGVPAVLIAFTLGMREAVYAALVFLVVQQIDGHVLMPMIQKRSTQLPPVLTILAVIGFGVLFGFIGILVATPLLLVVLILVRMLYVEDVLGDQVATPEPDAAHAAPVEGQGHGRAWEVTRRDARPRGRLGRAADGGDATLHRQVLIGAAVASTIPLARPERQGGGPASAPPVAVRRGSAHHRRRRPGPRGRRARKRPPRRTRRRRPRSYRSPVASRICFHTAVSSISVHSRRRPRGPNSAWVMPMT